MNGEHLRDGIIEVYGMVIDRDTTGDDFRAVLKEDEKVVEGEIQGNRCWSFYGKRSTKIGGHEFLPELLFFNGRGSHFVFTPLLDHKTNNIMEDQAARRRICDDTLEALLGDPDQRTDWETIYSFPWGVVCAISRFPLSKKYTSAGYISIAFSPKAQ